MRLWRPRALTKWICMRFRSTSLGTFHKLFPTWMLHRVSLNRKRRLSSATVCHCHCTKTCAVTAAPDICRAFVSRSNMSPEPHQSGIFFQRHYGNILHDSECHAGLILSRSNVASVGWPGRHTSQLLYAPTTDINLTIMTNICLWYRRRRLNCMK